MITKFSDADRLHVILLQTPICTGNNKQIVWRLVFFYDSWMILWTNIKCNAKDNAHNVPQFVPTYLHVYFL